MNDTDTGDTNESSLLPINTDIHREGFSDFLGMNELAARSFMMIGQISTID